MWRRCNPEPCLREFSLALLERAQTRHDSSVTVEYYRPASSRRLHRVGRGRLSKLSRHLSEEGDAISLLIIANLPLCNGHLEVRRATCNAR